MKYDFDTIIDRRGTHSLKWGYIQGDNNAFYLEPTNTYYEGDDPILPMWVADMDFPCPQPVIEALHRRVDQQIFGYTFPLDSYYETVIEWMEKRHGWAVQKDWICISPGIVPALHLLVRALVKEGDKVLIQRPVYYPFFSAIEKNGATLVSNSLVYDGTHYKMDFEDLEKKTRDPQVKLAILCSPHNPVGRVWHFDELKRFSEICLKNNVMVVSDEIHGDLIYSGHTFTPTATLGEAIANNTIVCTAPSKTFNMAGLHTSNIIIPNDTIRMQFKSVLVASGLFGGNTFGIAALEAAYTYGEDWLAQLMAYLEGNLTFLQQFVAEHIPKMTVIPAEGTYLIWLDCRRLGLDKWELKRLMLNEAKVYFDEGFIFGPEGEGFERINIACPRSLLETALQRMKTAIDQL